MAQLTATCECGHAGMWHTETRCKIRDCECTEFKHSVMVGDPQGRPRLARHQPTGRQGADQ